jgi:hypothetical protein
MKKILSLIILTILISCQTEVTTKKDIIAENSEKINLGTKFLDEMKNYNKNLKIVDQEFTDFENGNLQAMFDNASNDLIWSSPAGDSLTKDDWMNGMKDWQDGFKEFKFVNRDYYPSVDDSLYLPNGGVRSYGNWKFTHKETGTEFDVPYYSVQNFDEEGKANFILEMFDYGSIFLKLQ